MPLLVNNQDLRRARKETELALSRYRVADSDPPNRQELISVAEFAEEVTGAAVKSAIEAREHSKHVEFPTPWGPFKGSIPALLFLLWMGTLIWAVFFKK